MTVQRYEVFQKWENLNPDEYGDYVLYSEYAALEKRCAELERERDELKEKLDKVLNGPVWYWVDVAEEYEAENAMLRKRLEPIECAWSTKSNYLAEEFIDVMYEAIEKAMELKEGDNANSSHILG